MSTPSRLWRYGRLAFVAALVPLTTCVNGRVDAQRSKPDAPVWAVRCAALRGTERYRQAEACATALKRVKGLKADRVQVIHNDEESVVYYGRYKRIYDKTTSEPRFTPNQLPDIELIRSLSLSVDGRLSFPFIYATMEELPTSRPQHPEWDLAKADGHWSLHVAVFFNDENISNRRYLAETYCAELRSQGVEAYYRHGPAQSSVTVGLFPKQAVQTVTEKDPWTGAMQTVNRIVDPRLLELQRKFPYSYQNAEKLSEVVRDPKTGEITDRVPLASFIVIVPRAEAAENGTSGGQTPARPRIPSGENREKARGGGG